MLALAGAVVAVPVIIYLAMAQKLSENAILAASLSAGFAAFTAVTVWSEGIMPLVANHTVNLWGVQVWFDLLISVTVALFFIIARAQGWYVHPVLGDIGRQHGQRRTAGNDRPAILVGTCLS